MPDPRPTAALTGRPRLDELFSLACWEPAEEAEAAAILDTLERERDEAQALRRRVPNDEGGAGHEEQFWLRAKMRAAITQLRDIEDFYRPQGGTPTSFNQVRADRARQLYEAISDDFLNGSMSRATVRERAETAEAEVAELRRILYAAIDPETGARSAQDVRDLIQNELNATTREVVEREASDGGTVSSPPQDVLDSRSTTSFGADDWATLADARWSLGGVMYDDFCAALERLRAADQAKTEALQWVERSLEWAVFNDVYCTNEMRDIRARIESALAAAAAAPKETT